MLTNGELYTRPAGVDEGTYQRIISLRPLYRVTEPLILCLINIIEYIRKVRPWYKEKIKRVPKCLIGELLKLENEIGKLLAALTELAMNFEPGALPGHSDQMRALSFLFVQLVRELRKTLDHECLTELLKRISAYFTTLMDPVNNDLSVHDYRQRIKSRHDCLVAALQDVATYYLQFERELDLKITFSHLPATKADVATIVESAAEKTEAKLDTVIAIATKNAEVTRRIDRRTAGDKLRKREERQALMDNLHKIWEEAQENMSLRNSLNHPLTYQDAFIWYEKRIAALGVKNFETFANKLKNYAKAMSKKRIEDLEKANRGSPKSEFRSSKSE